MKHFTLLVQTLFESVSICGRKVGKKILCEILGCKLNWQGGGVLWGSRNAFGFREALLLGHGRESSVIRFREFESDSVVGVGCWSSHDFGLSQKLVGVIKGASAYNFFPSISWVRFRDVKRFSNRSGVPFLGGGQ